MDAFGGLSSDAVICCTWCSSSAALALNADLPTVMQLMSHILARADVQSVFQLSQVWSAMAQWFHWHHAIVMLPHASACFVPVVIMVASEMGTAILKANTWQRSFFLMETARGKPRSIPLLKLARLLLRSKWLICT